MSPNVSLNTSWLWEAQPPLCAWAPVISLKAGAPGCFRVLTPYKRRQAKVFLKLSPFLRSQFLNYLLALRPEQQLPGVQWPSKQEEGGERSPAGRAQPAGAAPEHVWELGTLTVIPSNFSLGEPLGWVRISRQIITYYFTCLTISSLFYTETDIRNRENFFPWQTLNRGETWKSTQIKSILSPPPWGKSNWQVELLGGKPETKLLCSMNIRIQTPELKIMSS